MKKILGLDLGTTSIGWALVNEKENDNEQSSIIKLGVRVNPLTTDEQKNFDEGKPITTNADRTVKRGMRRNLQRYKLRRDTLLSVLKEQGFISDDTILCEQGNRSTFQTLQLRAKAATEEVSLADLARILLLINKKRGYKSSRKVDADTDGKSIDGMSVARTLYENNLTPGEYAYGRLQQGKKYIPDFYPSDLRAELNRIWECQRQYYPEILTDALRESLHGKNEKQTWAICHEPFGIVGIKRNGNKTEQKVENYRWRKEALTKQLGLEELAIVLQKINSQINGASGLLGAISDRSKELYFLKQTVGQYQWNELQKNPNYSLKNQVFYRQDYLDEFERIWETQRKFHPELTDELKHELRDIVIFYQRPLKSQKGLVGFCELESSQKEIIKDGKQKTVTIGLRCCPKSSPLFQCFKIWQSINNISVTGNIVPERQRDLFGDEIINKYGTRPLMEEEKQKLFQELNLKERMSAAEILKLLFPDERNLKLNFKEVKGNTTMSAFVNACRQVIYMSGHDDIDFSKQSAQYTTDTIKKVFGTIGAHADFLTFDPCLDGKAFAMQPAYRLWHLLYSYTGDNSATGDERLKERIADICGLDKEYASAFASIALQDDYGSLSAKAMRKILPFMMDGNEYSVACEYAGYRHSKRSLTKEELDNKPLVNTIPLLKRNSLRNPVVEKILNQMINVVNTVSETYGKPDEIRIEMARELKKSAKEREQMTKDMNDAKKKNDEYKQVLQSEFGITNPTRNDVIRYRLYKELEQNGFKTIYTQTYIPKDKLFSKEFDIEHIIPQARLFDDSMSNKTIEARQANIEKGSATAYDYVLGKYGKQGAEEYKQRVDKMLEDGKISKTKQKKLLMREQDIPKDFIKRDLRNSQYIACKACEILESMVRTVEPTTGSVTDRLREDWQLVDVMKELNWDKYDRLGLTETITDHDGRQIRRIKDWTKRNDHRHHAMDALTIAFTRHSFIQYLNDMNARSDKSSSIYGIEQKELYRDSHGKLRFVPPMPLNEFRSEAKKHLEDILVSIKAKNKVMTKNPNKTKCAKGKTKTTLQLTPRGQLHNETIYGRIRQYATKEERVGSAFNAEKIATVANKRLREALAARLRQFDGDPKKAFTGQNSLEKKPIYLDAAHTVCVPPKVKTVTLEPTYTLRKEVNKDLNVEKVIDPHIRRILKERLKEYNDNAKEAFSNLEENPIWLNKEHGIAIKRVTISGVSNAIALHDKHDHHGKKLLDSEGRPMPTDFVSTSNNHHVAIFRDAEGNLQEHIVSFFEATMRASQHLPVIERDYNKELGWQFLFTMKQNEYFVFPNEKTGFNPNETDLLDPKNYAEISRNLFRVQKLSSKYYVFRHHLETTVEEKKELLGEKWKRIQTLNNLNGIVKVRVNHIGQIIAVGEY